MSWIRGVGQWLRVVGRFSRVESELDRELRDHLAREVEAQLQAGVTPDEARRRALLRVGHLDGVKEAVRDERGGRFVTDAITDLRVAWRGLRRNPGFTLAVVLSLALGGAGTTTIFSLVQAVLLRPLPYPDADRLHLVKVAWNDFSANLSSADLLRLRDQRGGVADVGAFWFPNNGFTMLTGAGAGTGIGPEVVQGANVSTDLPRVLGVAPAMGRLFSDGPDAREVLIGTDLWRQRFGASPDALGRLLTLDGVAYTIIGVMPPGYNVPGQSDGAVWVGVRPNEPTRRGPFLWTVLARLQTGITPDIAGTRLTAAVTPVLHERYRTKPDWRYRLLPMKEVLVGDVRQTLLLLFGAVGLVLVIAIVNVANLLLARGTARSRELAVRASLGAGRGRLARQLLTESALLGLLGGATGLAISFLLLDVVRTMAATLVPRLEEVRLDPVVIGFALLIGIAAGLLAGVLPVVRIGRQLGDVLRDGGRGAGEGVRAAGARRLLVAIEIALALTVLAGAALLVKTLVRVQSVDPGFRAEGVLSFRLSLPADPYRDTARLDAWLTALETRLRGLPVVSSVAYVTSLPPDLVQWSNNYTLEGTQPDGKGGPGAVAPWLLATPDYFATMSIPVRRGRGFAAADRAGAPEVAVVSEAFVRQHFPDGRAVGRRFKSGDADSRNPWITIVGVAGDVPYERGVWGGHHPTIYLAHAQNLGVRAPFVVIKTKTEGASSHSPHGLVPAVRQAVLSLDASVPLRDVASMTERMHKSTAVPRFRSVLFSLLAGVALLVAVTGIYGVLSFHVNQRRRETAIRRALGAPGTLIVRDIIAAGLRLTAIGIAIGLAGGLALARGLSGLLYDVRPNDPAVFASAAGVLMAAALAACAVPAIRALRIDPVSILRDE
jgi:putative ABC transport system permease protein